MDPIIVMINNQKTLTKMFLNSQYVLWLLAMGYKETYYIMHISLDTKA